MIIKLLDLIVKNITRKTDMLYLRYYTKGSHYTNFGYKSPILHNISSKSLIHRDIKLRNLLNQLSLLWKTFPKNNSRFVPKWILVEFRLNSEKFKIFEFRKNFKVMWFAFKSKPYAETLSPFRPRALAHRAMIN